MSGAEIDDQSPWGTHAPDALGALMLALTRNTPLGRGGSRAFFRSTIEARQQGPLDCEIYGRKIRGYLSGNRCEWKAILNPRLFDPLERKLTARMLARDKAVFLDIGANIGVHSLAAPAQSIAREAQ